MVAPLFRRKGFPQHKFPVQLNTQLPTGAVPSSEYLWGTHAAAIHNAENVKSAIFRSVAAATVVVTGVSAFISAPQQSYADVQPFIEQSLASGQATPVIPRVSGAPQVVDFTLQAVYSRPITSPQGPTVRPFTAGPLQVDLTQQAILSEPLPNRQGAVPPPVWQGQTDPSQLAPSIWQAIASAVVITPNPIAGFFVAPPQNEERPTRQVWPSLVAGQTPPVIRSIYAAPQLYDFTQQAEIIPAAIAQVVIITGTTVFPNTPVPPQTDTTVNASVVWTPSTFSPSAVPDAGAGLPAGGGRSLHHGFNLSDWKKKRKPLKDLEDDIERLYKEITSPPLARQAEKIVKPFVPPKLRDEIKPKNVEWDRVVESIRTIEKLHALYEQEIRDDDDDIEDLLTLL